MCGAWSCKFPQISCPTSLSKCRLVLDIQWNLNFGLILTDVYHWYANRTDHLVFGIPQKILSESQNTVYDKAGLAVRLIKSSRRIFSAHSRNIAEHDVVLVVEVGLVTLVVLAVRAVQHPLILSQALLVQDLGLDPA